MDKYKIVGRRVKVVVVVVLNHTVNVWAQVTPGEYEGTIEKSCQARCTGAVGCGALGTVNSVKGGSSAQSDKRACQSGAFPTGAHHRTYAASGAIVKRLWQGSF